MQIRDSEVADIPSGILAGFVEQEEVRILAASKETLVFRSCKKIRSKAEIRIKAYHFKRDMYDCFSIKNYHILEEEEREFYVVYRIGFLKSEAGEAVWRVICDYNRYIMLKCNGFENEFSMEMTGYPANLEGDYEESYAGQKAHVLSEVDTTGVFDYLCASSLELSVALDNPKAYEKYLELDKAKWLKKYLESNDISCSDTSVLIQRVERIYIGNAFCHHLMPDLDTMLALIHKAVGEKIEITLVCSGVQQEDLYKMSALLEGVYRWCESRKVKIEVTANDYGVLNLLRNWQDYFIIRSGILLNKMHKDPRYRYKNGNCDAEGYGSLERGSLQEGEFIQRLKELGVSGWEYESCGRKQDICLENSSLHLPFYQTNTSSYCPLSAVVLEGSRAKQRKLKECKQLCRAYAMLYPKHLKLFGLYNSLFGLDVEILKDTAPLQYFIKAGIKRIVLNYIS